MVGTPTRPIPATPSAQAATRPAGCGAAEVTVIIERFLAAFNAGDQDQLLRLFPARAVTNPGVLRPGEERVFTRFWVSRQVNGVVTSEFEAYRREDLPPYFARRHAQHERLTFHKLDIGGIDWTGGVGFGIALTREADDLPPYYTIGKGEVDCQERTIFVWSI